MPAMIRLCLVACLVLAACGKKDNNLVPDAPAGSCTLKQQGEACTNHSDCCSGVCDPSGTCAASPNGCDGFGVACATGATCCSGSCTDTGGGNF